MLKRESKQREKRFAPLFWGAKRIIFARVSFSPLSNADSGEILRILLKRKGIQRDKRLAQILMGAEAKRNYRANNHSPKSNTDFGEYHFIITVIFLPIFLHVSITNFVPLDLPSQKAKTSSAYSMI